MTTWTIREVAAACGLSHYEISAWISRGMFRPSMSTRKGEWRHYDWRDVVCLAVVGRLRRFPLETATALRCAGDELREVLAGYEVLPRSPLTWCVRQVGDRLQMSFAPELAAAPHAAPDATLAVDVARVGWAALHHLEAAGQCVGDVRNKAGSPPDQS